MFWNIDKWGYTPTLVRLMGVYCEHDHESCLQQSIQNFSKIGSSGIPSTPTDHANHAKQLSRSFEDVFYQNSAQAHTGPAAWLFVRCSGGIPRKLDYLYLLTHLFTFYPHFSVCACSVVCITWVSRCCAVGLFGLVGGMGDGADTNHKPRTKWGYGKMAVKIDTWG